MKKAFICALMLSLVFVLSGCGKPKGWEHQAKQVLTKMQNIVDDAVNRELKLLRKVAKTDCAKNRDWLGIKQLLCEKYDADNASLYWFSLVDGSYYTSAAGKVSANLYDRAYFKYLLAGEEVVSHPVVGKTSGRKSLVVAVPIMERGCVVGMLGASIYLEYLNLRVKEELALTPDVIAYALTDSGMCVLETGSGSLLMKSPSNCNNYALKDIAPVIVAYASGTNAYIHDGINKNVLYKYSKKANLWYAVAIDSKQGINLD